MSYLKVPPAVERYGPWGRRAGAKPRQVAGTWPRNRRKLARVPESGCSPVIEGVVMLAGQ